MPFLMMTFTLNDYFCENSNSMPENEVLLSLVVPVFNEEQNIPILTKKVHQALDDYNFELIFIDDCSTDNTRQVIKTMNDPKVVLLTLKKKYGQSLAMAAGFELAAGDYIVTLDGDLQNDPKDIPIMLKKLVHEDWDLVTGFREKRRDSLLKTIPSRVANFIIRITTKLNVKDQGCALKVFKKETAKELNLYGEMHRFIALVAHLDGARITEISVQHHARKYGISKYGLGRTFKVINDLLLILFQRNFLQKPIYFFGNIGLFLFGGGALICLYFLILKLLGEDIWGRPLLILAVVLLVVGIQFFSIGILYDLLMKTYFESQEKKPYQIRKIFRFKG